MTKTLEAIFDGKVFLPDEPLELAPDTRVRITIEATVEREEIARNNSPYPLDSILAGATDMGVTDLASRHDYYAHNSSEEQDDHAG